MFINFNFNIIKNKSISPANIIKKCTILYLPCIDASWSRESNWKLRTAFYFHHSQSSQALYFHRHFASIRATTSYNFNNYPQSLFQNRLTNLTFRNLRLPRTKHCHRLLCREFGHLLNHTLRQSHDNQAKLQPVREKSVQKSNNYGFRTYQFWFKLILAIAMP